MTFDFTPTQDGLRIHDQIENVWTDIDAGGRVEPEPASTDAFSVPLDDAVRFNTDRLVFDRGTVIPVWTGDRRLLGIVEDGDYIEPHDTLELECDSLDIVLYIRFADCGVSIDVRPAQTELAFDAPVLVEVGVRTFHEHPAGVVSTSDDPRDLMAAVSTFGSALKTQSPERAFPTLRGHPPELAVRTRLDIPDGLEPPDTGIELQVPPGIGAIFTASPLSYYLGATIVPGAEPEIHAHGRTFSLDVDDLARSVHDVLQHLFVLDCVVRTAGLYPVHLEERTTVEERVEIDVPRLYELPIAQRTAEYLELPVGRFSDLLTWPQMTDVEPGAQRAELLPYLAYRLSSIRSPPAPHSERVVQYTAPPESRMSYRDPTSRNDGVRVIEPVPSEAAQHTWVGDGIPVGGTAAMLDAYVSSINHTPKPDAIEVVVVCTESTMEAEVERLYTFDSQHEITADIRTDVTRDELRTLLHSDVDFFHFAGHITPQGLCCTDGVLDIATLQPSRLPAFFLNGCISYRQGVEFVKNGSAGGLVSLEPLQNEYAIKAGRELSRFLSYGCTLSQAVLALSRVSPLEYAVVGDADYRVCACEDPTPLFAWLDTNEATRDSIRITTEPIAESGPELGRLMHSALDRDAPYRLESTHPLTYTAATIEEFFDVDNLPLLIDDDLTWLEDLTPDELLARIEENVEESD